MPPPNDKPPYRVPLMAEIAAVPANGYSVASTFSGCGGSSTGYRMAGFHVLWASEFVEAASSSYRANMAPGTILDGRDIRQVKPEEILDATGLAAGELDVLDGSPPCASFSTAGKRHSHWGEEKAYSDTKQRTDDLFFEFARILRGLQPKTFVAENVSGLVKGIAKGYFIEILAALKDCGYRVEARLLDAQWLGVPQSRQRIIFLGVRNDLGLAPAFPKPLPYRYSVRDALPWIASCEWQSGGQEGTRHCNVEFEPLATVRSANAGATTRYLLTEIGTFKGARCADLPAPTVMSHGRASTRSELTIAVEPEADIARFAIGEEWDRTPQGGQSSRYFSLVKPHPDRPSPTVTQLGGDSSAASVVHPTEKRKFSIAELKRICGFPDDFVLTGTYAQQWERLGRAVPPPMMAAIAAAIRDRVLNQSR